MRVISKGHKYGLINFEGSTPQQTLQFIEKEPAAEGSTELVTVNDGTTNEEVLLMLISRMNYLQDKFPCPENAKAIKHLKKSLMWLEFRTESRKIRGVEGKQEA
jgi:hypothetical protein